MCFYRFIKCTVFTCQRCGLKKKSKLVAFAKNKWNESLYNNYYGYLYFVDPKPHSTINCLNANGNKVLRVRVIKARAKQQIRIFKKPKIFFISYLKKFQKIKNKGRPLKKRLVKGSNDCSKKLKVNLVRYSRDWKGRKKKK